MKEIKDIKELFYLFVGNEPLRPAMNNPFFKEDYIYATDTHILIRALRKDADFEYENKFEDKAPNAGAIMREHNCNIKIDINLSELEKLCTEDEYTDGEDIDCGLCDGEGQLYESYFYKDKWHGVEFDCPVCDGSGIEETKPKTLTGNKIFGNKSVKINNKLFKMDLFYKIIQVHKFTNEPIYLVYDNEDKYNSSTFICGKFEILIMPIQYTDYEEYVLTIL